MDRAFQRRPRKSKYVFEYGTFQVCLVNGMNTGNLGVETIDVDGEPLRVTNLARTLIDATIRPAYAGGCSAVMKAFKKAKDRVSADQIIAMLKKIKYVYPYHQAIGFYMENVGFDEEAVNKLRKLGLRYDFYLDYNMKKKAFSKEWRIYHPKDLR